LHANFEKVKSLELSYFELLPHIKLEFYFIDYYGSKSCIDGQISAKKVTERSCYSLIYADSRERWDLCRTLFCISGVYRGQGEAFFLGDRTFWMNTSKPLVGSRRHYAGSSSLDTMKDREWLKSTISSGHVKSRGTGRSLILEEYSKAHGQNIDGSDTLSGGSYRDHPPGQK
jgi:hypothetical protein